jgi:hypothetical protein
MTQEGGGRGSVYTARVPWDAWQKGPTAKNCSEQSYSIKARYFAASPTLQTG